MTNLKLSSEFIQYLVLHANDGGDGQTDTERLPSLNDFSKELGLSVARLREQLEVAKAIGLVEVRPKVEFANVLFRLRDGDFDSAVRALLVFRAGSIPQLRAAGRAREFLLPHVIAHMRTPLFERYPSTPSRMSRK